MTARNRVIALCARNRGNDAETCCTGECEQGRRCPLLARRIEPPPVDSDDQRTPEDDAFRARILRRAVFATVVFWAIFAALIWVACGRPS